MSRTFGDDALQPRSTTCCGLVKSRPGTASPRRSEVWHHYAGAPLTPRTSATDGESLTSLNVLGADVAAGQQPLGGGAGRTTGSPRCHSESGRWSAVRCRPPLRSTLLNSPRPGGSRERSGRRSRRSWTGRSTREEVALVDVRWYLDGRSGHAAYESGPSAGRDLAGSGYRCWPIPPSPQARVAIPLPEPGTIRCRTVRRRHRRRHARDRVRRRRRDDVLRAWCGCFVYSGHPGGAARRRRSAAWERANSTRGPPVACRPRRSPHSPGRRKN